MTFTQAFIIGLGIALGVETAVGFCYAVGSVFKGAKKK